MKFLWPDGDSMAVKCPKCSKIFDSQISIVKELNLSVRPVECQFCYCDFEVHHTGTVNLVEYTSLYPPQEFNSFKQLNREELLKMKFIFNPEG